MNERLKEGDILYSKLEEKFYVYKILRVDEYPFTYHALTYAPIKKPPNAEDLKNFKVLIYHAPIASFPNSKLLTNIPVKKEELEGYFEYLKLTNFPRYLKETGQDVKDVIAKAQDAYNKANQLCTERNFEEAIELYSEAIELFPLFYEAIDNRGLTYMDLGMLEEAISDFEQSLNVEPKNFLAIFSIGECYFKMEEYPKALKQFEKALEIEPRNDIGLEWLEKTKKILEENKNG